MKKYDAVIIGALGSGLPLAQKMAQAGWQIALVHEPRESNEDMDRTLIMNRFMAASARQAHLAHLFSGYDIHSGAYEAASRKALKDCNTLSNSQERHGEQWEERTAGLDIIRGTASFVGQKELLIHDGATSHLILGTYFFINTGMRPMVPEIDGLDDVQYQLWPQILTQEVIPAHLVISGGSSSALAIGQMYSRLGSKVTILVPSSCLLTSEDDDVVEEVEGILRAEKIQVFFNVSVRKVLREIGGGTALTVIRDGKNSEIITCSHWLITAGYAPNTELLALELTGVQKDVYGFIETNEFLETSVKGIYALGANKKKYKCSPSFLYEQWVICQRLLDNKVTPIIQYPCLFNLQLDPELFRLGITEKEVKYNSTEIKVTKMKITRDMLMSPGADKQGFIKVIIHLPSEQVLGVVILLPDADGLLAVFQMAMVNRLTYKQMLVSIALHPVYAKILHSLFDHL